MTIRFGILAGVSSDPQARIEKGSIPDQIATCRKVIEQFGGYEVDVYIMDGFSRTGYDSLADAMNDIPPLKEAIEAAETGKYDVLILDNFDRLGDLGQLVSTRFRKYKKQLYSARQSGRFHAPDEYDPWADESSDISMHVEAIIQRYRLNKIRRGLVLGIKKRVEDGKYSVAFPYGYLKEHDGSLSVDAPVAQLLIRLKDLFLGGASLRQLEHIANKSGVPSARGAKWSSSNLARTLSNPFYAGKVFNGRWKMVGRRVMPNGKRAFRMKLNPNATLYDGKHQPLWTWDEHLRIGEEMKERYKMHPRHNVRNFSGLLVCTVCKKRLRMKDGKYRCYPGRAHVLLPDAEANEKIGVELAEALRNYTDKPAPKPVVDTTQDAIEALKKKISKVHHHLELEIYTATEAKEKIDNLRAQIKTIEAGREDAQRKIHSRERIRSRREQLLPVLDLFPIRFERDDPRVNNRLLRDLLTAIYVTPEHTFTFDFR